MEKYTEKHSNQTMLISDIYVDVKITKIEGYRGVTLDWRGVGSPVNNNDSNKLRSFLHNNPKFFTEDFGVIEIRSITENPLSFMFHIRGRT